jgi:DNA-binding transcriptional ArsR family regulator
LNNYSTKMKPKIFKPNPRMIRFFSALADETRLSMLLCLAEGPKTVNDVYSYVGRNKLTLSAISHQLKDLKNIGIIEFEKKGREKVFRLSDKFCWCILRDAVTHFRHEGRCMTCNKIQKDYKVLS